MNGNALAGHSFNDYVLFARKTVKFINRSSLISSNRSRAGEDHPRARGPNGRERVPYGSERPNIRVKGPHESERVTSGKGAHEDEGAHRCKGTHTSEF